MSSKKHQGSPSILKAYLNAPNQVLAAGWNVIRLDAVLPNHNRLNEFNVATNIFIPSHAGYYFIYAQTNGIIAAGVGFLHAIEISLNGVTIADDRMVFQSVGGTNCVKTSTLQYLTPNDQIRILATGYAGPNIVTLLNSASETFLTIFRVR